MAQGGRQWQLVSRGARRVRETLASFPRTPDGTWLSAISWGRLKEVLVSPLTWQSNEFTRDGEDVGRMIYSLYIYFCPSLYCQRLGCSHTMIQNPLYRVAFLKYAFPQIETYIHKILFQYCRFTKTPLINIFTRSGLEIPRDTPRWHSVISLVRHGTCHVAPRCRITQQQIHSPTLPPHICIFNSSSPHTNYHHAPYRLYTNNLNW